MLQEANLGSSFYCNNNYIYIYMCVTHKNYVNECYLQNIQDKNERIGEHLV
jgi:hypothetical protein